MGEFFLIPFLNPRGICDPRMTRPCFQSNRQQALGNGQQSEEGVRLEARGGSKTWNAFKSFEPFNRVALFKTLSGYSGFNRSGMCDWLSARGL
jgi:hypothetical protein